MCELCENGSKLRAHDDAVKAGVYRAMLGAAHSIRSREEERERT
jgi:hypothetical protein